MRTLPALCFAALIGVAVPGAASAQTPLDLKDARSRAVQIQVIRQRLDGLGNLVDAAPEAPRASNLTSGGGRLRAALAPEDGAKTFALDPFSLAGGTVMVTFSNGRFSELSDQVTTLDPRTGAARISRTASGMLTVEVNAFGMRIVQPIAFDILDLAATDMGPLFLAQRAPLMIGLRGGGAGGALTANAGARAVCAKAGSPFLMMDVGIPDCAATFTRTDPMTMMRTTVPLFADPRPVDPKPFDPQTGEIRPVGVQVVRMDPLVIQGRTLRVPPIVSFKLDAVQRITEAN